MQPALDISPPLHRGMENNLDRSAFHKSIPVLAVRIAAQKTGVLLKSDAMRSYVMDMPKIRSVVWDPSSSDDHRLVLLKISEEAALSPEARTLLIDHSAEIVDHTINLDYNYWTADDILQAILPEQLLDGSPTGFSVTGHIAHMNLNKEYLPYKNIIGQIILDKNPAIKTVVNKLDSIDNKFRFFKMELLAGEPNYIVEHHESNCRFIFDFSKVYWNSRLHTEHDRLVQLFKPEDVIADVFAGVGPFAIPAARKGCAVLANDLNPDSVHYLSKNIATNDVADLVHASCEDGREFIRTSVSKVMETSFPPYSGPRISRVKGKRRRREIQALEHRERHPTCTAPCSDTLTQPPRKAVTRFVMNLPDSALDFLDAFQGILSAQDDAERKLCYPAMPMIHCYCFTRELEQDKAELDIKERAENRLGHRIEEDVSFHLVRSVAPNKYMYCISFRLPRDVVFGR
ncbi:hypothetical protein SCLCIDRAFT_101548 [Scleroderma citrinum Foug A]|uniref:tRNA (guanine(37)-N1)-methyltransferase n=1 Tax=Scleroderma citrinum Foug A TaxID=1036808 RepID=A0A0C3ER44_9AGAM|nr:hypothetical protein SCLCIDRAFT_101548 [Scleroderma citrinum Foug A]